uniref:Mannosyl-oligosaccharide glucosidase n=1 Tax=Accipiter nisus TaxID=211598 RepID=A0A8B9RZD9_9AVES
MAGERRRRGGEGPRERTRERGTRREREKEQQRGSSRGRAALVIAAAAAAAALALGLAAAEWKRWNAAALLVTPHPAPPALPPGSAGPLASPQRFWGTYRPHVYFGMKTRSPRALVTGLMWLQQREGGGSLRHTCEQSDGLSRYGWLMHDGENFGVQEIRDEGLFLKTEFVKRPGGEHGGDWSWRITAWMEVRGRSRGAAPDGRMARQPPSSHLSSSSSAGRRRPGLPPLPLLLCCHRRAGDTGAAPGEQDTAGRRDGDDGGAGTFHPHLPPTHGRERGGPQIRQLQLPGGSEPGAAPLDRGGAEQPERPLRLCPAGRAASPLLRR